MLATGAAGKRRRAGGECVEEDERGGVVRACGYGAGCGALHQKEPGREASVTGHGARTYERARQGTAHGIDQQVLMRFPARSEG